MASEVFQYPDNQSDATSESFSLRLTPSPIDDESGPDDYETPDNRITNEGDNDDDSVVCHLVRHDLTGKVRLHIQVLAENLNISLIRVFDICQPGVL